MKAYSLPLVVLLAACETSVSEDRISRLENDVQALKADRDDLVGQVETLQGELQDCLVAGDLEGYVSESTLSTVLDAYPTETELTAALDGYVTETELGAYASTSETEALDARLAEVEDAYVSEDALFAMDYASQSSVDALDVRVDALESVLGSLEGRIGSIEADYVPEDDIGDVVRLISEDASWFAETADGLRELLDDLDRYRIAHEKTLTITLDAKVFTFEAPLVLRHPQGGRLRIEGAGVGETTFIFSASDGIVVDEGSDLGFLGGLTIQGLGTPGAAGITVDESAGLTLGDVDVADFGDKGILVTANAYLVAEGVVNVSGCGDGIVVSYSAFALFEGASCTGNDDEGFLSDNGSLIAENSRAEGNGGDGFLATRQSYLNAASGQSYGNDGAGFYSAYNSYLGASSSQSGSELAPNGGYGYLSSRGGYMYAGMSTASHNVSEGYAADYFSSIFAVEATAEANGASFETEYNSYIYAHRATADTAANTYNNDTTNYIYGL